METIGISCSCGNNHAFVLSRKLAECTQCVELHNIEESQSYSTYDVIPLHVIEQRAKEQAIKDMLDEWHLKCHENNIKAELDSIYRRDIAAQHACAFDAGIISQEEYNNLIHNLNDNRELIECSGKSFIDWSTCFDTNRIEHAI